jgi:uncharacterized protein YjiS (DUF1127 family)
MTTITKTYCAMCDKISGLFKRTKIAISEDAGRRNTYKVLSALSDADLRDIGITRGDIRYISEGGKPFRRY